MTPEQITANFRTKVPGFMDRFIAAFSGSTELDAAAVFGNAGTESLGFTTLQEIKPVIAGSRGGYGFFQWTGPRRDDFETWCLANKLAVSSDEASLSFLFHELRTTQVAALHKLWQAVGLNAKTIAFERTYERAGVPNFNSRLHWAQIALDAWHDAKGEAA